MWILNSGLPSLLSLEQAPDRLEEGDTHSLISLEASSKIPSTVLFNHDFHTI